MENNAKRRDSGIVTHRMRIKEELQRVIKQIVSDLGVEGIEPVMETPAVPSHGDYSTNIAMAIFSNSKFKIQNSKLQVKTQKYKSPLELAEAIAELLNTKYQIPNTDLIEAVAPGFINFHLSKDYLVGRLNDPLSEKEKFGQTARLKDKSIIVEFTDPNPFKEFHIGHLYSNVVGESLCRLLEANGARVMRANYQGDVGMHVAKALYGLLQNLELRTPHFAKASRGKQNSELDKKPLDERAKLLGEAYALGAKAYEGDETAKKEINELNKKIYQKEPEIMDLYEKGRQWSLDYFETIYKRLGTKFDFYYFESKVGEIGLKLVKQYVSEGIFEESEGAVVFPGKQFGLHTRVFINSQGFPTYEAKELGLAPTKYEDFPYDQSIIVTGNEIIEYFKVLMAALAKIRPDLALKTKHIPHGMVRLKQGKMSSRTGDVVTGQWLLDETKGKIKERFSEIKDEVAEQVAVGAVKYALLKSGLGRDIVFDFEESINLEGNSGPYLQYTYARTRSVLAKSRIQNSEFRISLARSHLARLEVEELVLLRLLHRFPEVVGEAAEKFTPNFLCNYLFNLAQAFNLFYQKHQIIGSQQEAFRLSLTRAIGQTLKEGLDLLGIVAPQRM